MDGLPRVLGTARFGADHRPEDVLTVRAVRSPHARARFEIGDLGPLRRRHPGLVDVMAAADVPGQNRYGIYPSGKDQPASNYSMSGAMNAVMQAGAPKMDPNRRIQSQDCARPIDMAAGNLRCN